MSWNINLPTAWYFDHQTEGLANIVREVEEAPEVAIDTETTGLSSWGDLPLYWSLAYGNKRMTLNVSALPYFEHAFQDVNKTWIFANAKFDMHMLANIGVYFWGNIVDTQVMHALLYEDRSHKLKDMAIHLLGWRWSDFKDTFGKITKTNTAGDVIRKAERENFGLLVEYAANDSWGTLACYNTLKDQLQKANTFSFFNDKPPYIRTLWDLFWKVEMPYTRVLWNCERNGVLINVDRLEEIGPTIIDDINELDREIVQVVGDMINPGSDADLRKYWFEVKKYRPIKVTKGGKTGVRQASVDAFVVERLAEDGDPVAALVLKRRDLKKLHSTYVKGLHSHLDTYGRIHTRFNQDVARTGRLSSSNPNLQNIPNAERDKWKTRAAFIAPEGYELIVADYSQLEMRLLACASLEADMIEVFNRGWDIHMGNASMMMNIPYEEIKDAKKTDKMVKMGQLGPEAITTRVQECLDARAACKNIGFGLVYGMGDKKLANDLKIPIDEARKLSAYFRERYPAVDAFTKESVEEAREKGYAFTLIGRRRNLPEISSHNRKDRMEAERKAVNTPIQGTAADVIRMAQTMLYKAGVEQKYGARMLLQIHDELVFECPKETVPEAMQEIKDWMEHPFCEDLVVPLDVDIGHGLSWMDAK